MVAHFPLANSLAYYLLPTYCHVTATGQAEKKRANTKKREVAKITGGASERQVEKQQRQAAACFTSFGISMGKAKPVGK